MKELRTCLFVFLSIILVYSVNNETQITSAATISQKAIIKNLGGSYKGTIQSGKNFKFTLSKDGKKITKISADVLEYCDGSLYSNWTKLYLDGPFTVKKGGVVSAKGKEKYDGVTATYSFTAKISNGKASGTIDQSTIVAGSVCKTYKLKWKAQKR